MIVNNSSLGKVQISQFVIERIELPNYLRLKLISAPPLDIGKGDIVKIQTPYSPEETTEVEKCLTNGCINTLMWTIQVSKRFISVCKLGYIISITKLLSD